MARAATDAAPPVLDECGGAQRSIASKSHAYRLNTMHSRPEGKESLDISVRTHATDCVRSHANGLEVPMPRHTDRPARVLRDTVRRLLVAHGTLDDAQRPCGAALPTSHAWALLELRDAGPMTVTALAERLNIDRTNVSRLCARMSSSGEVERVANPADGRARLVQLTDKGERLAATVDQSSTEYFATVLARLDAEVVDVIEVVDAATWQRLTGSTLDPAMRRGGR